MRIRRIKRRLGYSLGGLVFATVALLTVLKVQAGIAVWTPPSIQMIVRTANGGTGGASCAVADNKVYCWGNLNTYGQLGTGDNTTLSYIPRQVSDPNGVLVGKKITGLALANTGTVCVVASNVPYCWGRGNYGALGDNTTSDRYYPSAVTTSGVLAGKTITNIGAGDAHVCVVASGAAYCWGANGNGRLGDGSTTQRNTPVAVNTSGVLSGKTVTNIVAGSGHTCAAASGAAYCWGDDTNGTLGNDSSYTGSTTAVAVDTSGVLSGKTISFVSGGSNDACALATDGTAYCWGGNSGGQLGNNSTTTSPVPVAVYTSGALSGKTLKTLTIGDYRSCAIDTNNDAYCWGLGPVGDGSGGTKLVPTAVTTTGVLNGMDMVQVAPSRSGNCFLNSQNRMYCTSNNGDGSLGNNTINNSAAPVQVLFTSTFNAPNYRFYANADSATPGSPLAGINSTTTLTSYGEAFRVRMGVKTSPQMGSIKSGSDFSCGLVDGDAYCWGYGSGGRLGNNSTTASSVPVAVDTSGVLSGKTILSISTGYGHACVIASDNQAYCWGSNGYGQLGNNSTSESHVPVAVYISGALSGKMVLGIGAGQDYTCAIASDNNAYCWGTDFRGQLGDGDDYDKSVPTAVYTGGTLSGKTIRSLSAGLSHVCAIASDNNAYCWGLNDYGQYGSGSVTSYSFPALPYASVPVAVSTSGVLSGKTILSIAAGNYHTCAIASDNLAYCWGYNSNGQLGNNSTTQSSSPVAVSTSGVLSGKTIQSISPGKSTIPHTCAIASDSQTYCWGYNSNGQLGNNSTTQSIVPVATSLDGHVPSADINPSDNTYKLQFAQKTVSACSAQTGYADVTGSTAIAFNTNASVSNGASISATANDPVPTTDSVPQAYISSTGTFTNSSTITSGKTGLWDFSLKDNSGLYSTTYCLRMTYGDGTNIEGTAQYPELTTVSKVAVKESAYRLYDNADSITPGTALAATDTAGSLTTTGQTFRLRTGLVSVAQMQVISSGASHVCGIADGKAYCWGDNSYGQLGNNSTSESDVPVAVDTSGVLSGKTVIDVEVGDASTCALTSDGQVYCWGHNNYGQVGDNSTSQRNVPVAVYTSGALSGKLVLKLAMGSNHACVVASDNNTYCWGNDGHGQLGDNSTTQSSVPVAVDTSGVLSGKAVSYVTTGQDYSCVIASDSNSYCWGYNNHGQLGDNSTSESHVPVAVNTAGVLSGKTISLIDAGVYHTCAIASDNNAYCWGYNAYGQLGNNSISQSTVPVAVSTSGVLSGKTVLSVGVGGGHTCAIASDNNAYCWGYDSNGQLGDNSITEQHVPVAVDTSGVLSGMVISSLSAGTYHTCAIASDNTAYCWGGNTTGQLGDSSTTESHVAVSVHADGNIDGPQVIANANQYKLQFAKKTLSTCSVQTGFADVTGSTAIAFNTNGSVSNGTSITSNANDPVPTGDSVPQTYISATGTFTNANAITSGKTGLWDFSLKDNSGLYSTSYCLRIVYGDGTVTTSGSAFPEVQTAMQKTDVASAPYRFYQNANSLTPGSTLGVTSQPLTLSSPDQTFRLRTGVIGALSALKISTGSSHACIVASDNNAYCWGYNSTGQLGNNRLSYYSLAPTAVDTSGVLSGKTVSSISAGAFYTCAIASDNNAYCWGQNDNGQLGDNSSGTDRLVPVAVNTSGVLSGKTILAISTATTHTCAIASDNNAYCWGDNTNGQLGNNSTTQSLVPVAVNTSGVLSGKTILAIRTGTSHTCVIASDNNAYCWGLNTYGQLGNNSTTQSLVPVAVTTSGVLSGKTVTALSTGNTHTCVIASDNNAYCWGHGANGRLGNGSGSDSLVPVAVTTSGVLSGKTITSITAGGSHTCAIASDSRLYCWGYNQNGYLGNNSSSDSSVPVAVDTSGVLLNKTITSVSSKFFDTCALSSDGQAYCWGNNGSGQLGMGDTAIHLVPQRVASYLAGYKTGVPGKTSIAVAGGTYHTCAIASDNNAYCWGYDSNGQLGDGNVNTMSPTTVSAVDTSGVLSGKTILAIAPAFYHTCAIASDNQAYCWGMGIGGKLGNNSTTQSAVPVAVDTSGVLAGKTVLSIATAAGSNCVIASDNQAYCWGSNTYGQMGDGTSGTNYLVPSAVDTSGVLSGKTIKAVSIGTTHTCVIASDNKAYCWGGNSNGQIGDGTTGTNRLVPVAVSTSGVLAGKTLVSISAGAYHTCVVDSNGAAYCWGTGGSGRLGNNSTSDSNVPVAVNTAGALSGKTILSISAGHYHTCAIASDNQAYCWGSNTNGQLGNNSTTQSTVPVAVNTPSYLSGKTILSMSAGDSHNCELASDNQLYCWGYNIYSQLGEGSTTNSLVPTIGFTVSYTPIGASVSSSPNTYKLQYATKSASTCSAQTTGFADVTTSTPIAFNTNASATNGAAISTTANDPLGSSQTVAQTYISAPGTFTNSNTITYGTMGMWDFSLKDNGAPYGTSYCLRIAYGDGAGLPQNAALPEVKITSGTLSVGFVNSLGVGVASPTSIFGGVTAVTSSWQPSYGTLGSSSQKLRVYNDLATNGWSASIAATNGPTALWDRSDHLAKYDFNEAAPYDGPDSDSLGGGLGVDPSVATVTSPTGCSTSGISLGSQTAFSEGTTDSISLFAANSTAAMGCAYDLSSVGLVQVIPASQATGTYTIDMTVTVVAL